MVFELDQESDQKLWVRTPMPISKNVWAEFVYGVFPVFSIDHDNPPDPAITRDSDEKNWPSSADQVRWGQSNKYKYLERRQNPDFTGKTILRDGACGFPWTHAELPDDFRTGAKLSNWGVIYIPHPSQSDYVDQLKSNIPDSKGFLETLNEEEDRLVEHLFEAYDAALEVTEPSPNNIRTYLNGRGAFQGSLLPRKIGEPDPSPELSYKGSYAEDGFLKRRTQIDFLEIVDSRLALYPRNTPLTTNELTGLHELFSIYGDSIDRARKYSGRLKVA